MLIPLIIACALFMENLDSSVVATALPAIATDLGVDPIALKLAFTSYLISIAVFTPVSGWVADRFGSRTVFASAIAVFVAGSLLCGFSWSLPGFVAARILQGIGGAMMMPVGRLVLFKSIAKSDYVRALSWLTVPALIGPVLGPPVGGFITTFFHWRWIFWINIPISIVGITLVLLHIPNIVEAPRPLDIKGFILSSLGLGGFVFGVAASGIGLLPHAVVIAMILGGLACLVAYVRHARLVENPLIDLDLFRIATYRTSVLGGLFFRAGVGALPFLLPLLFQIGFGMNAFDSGLLTFATAAGAIAMKFTAPQLLRRFGFRRVLLVNSLLSTAALLVCILFTADTSRWTILIILLIGGFFRSLQFTSLNALGFSDLDTPRMSQATSLSSVCQQLSVAGGVALAAGLLEFARSGHPAVGLVASDFALALGISGLVSLAALPVFYALPKSAGADVSGHRGV